MKKQRNCSCPYCRECASPSRRFFLDLYAAGRRVASQAWQAPGLFMSTALQEQLREDLPTLPTSRRVVTAALLAFNRAIEKFLFALILMAAVPTVELLGLLLRPSSRTLSCACFVSAVNCVPSPKARKLLLKLVADQAEHIAELDRLGARKTARWNWWCTWGLIAWYACMHTVTNVMKAVRGRSAT